MKKFVVIIALLILILGVISLLISETRLEEQVIDEWNPIIPSTLDSHNSTGWFFIRRPLGNNTRFRQLFEQGEISELFLELNATASDPVRVRIGRIIYNASSGTVYLVNATFNEKGTNITERIEIEIDEYIRANADFIYLEITNEEVNPVSIAGDVKLRGEMPNVFYPFYGFGTLMCLVGFSLAVYGLLAKPKRKRALPHATYALRDVANKKI